MNAILKAFIMPHPPIIVSEIGRGNEKAAQKTINGCKRTAAAIAKENPETIIIITPHGPVFRDAVCLGADSVLRGDFGRFGQKSLGFEFQNDMELCKSICDELEKNEIFPIQNNGMSRNTYGIDSSVDHGALVPLYFISKQLTEFKIIHMTYGMLGPEDLYKCGMSIRKAIEKTGRKTCIVASADLSHRLTYDAPAGYNPDGKKYDEFVVGAIRNKRFAEFLDVDCDVRENAGECGHRSITIMLGAFEGRKCETEVFSYEGPFGVGYMCASVTDTGCGGSVLEKFRGLKAEKNGIKRKNESYYVELARGTIEEYIKTGKKTKPQKKSLEKRGTFVSIKKNGVLRGCIGTIGPTRDCIEDEIIDNAVKAATQDPRFPPITENELNELSISVDILYEPEKINDRSMLDTVRYGVIVTKGAKRGLLLPNLTGIDSVDEQLRIALQKAGIDESADYEMERFRVERYK